MYLKPSLRENYNFAYLNINMLSWIYKCQPINSNTNLKEKAFSFLTFSPPEYYTLLREILT